MNAKIALIIFLSMMASGCAQIYIDKSISSYDDVENQIELGNAKESVLSILLPTQKDLPKSASKRPDQYIKNGVKVEIYYMRSARQPDGLTTDDEFTPYIFNDGVLVGIDWAYFGGPKTQGQATPVTNVNVKNNTVVY